MQARAAPRLQHHEVPHHARKCHCSAQPLPRSNGLRIEKKKGPKKPVANKMTVLAWDSILYLREMSLDVFGCGRGRGKARKQRRHDENDPKAAPVHCESQAAGEEQEGKPGGGQLRKRLVLQRGGRE